MGFCNSRGSMRKQITQHVQGGEREREIRNLFERMKEGALLYRERDSSSSVYPDLLGYATKAPKNHLPFIFSIYSR